MRNGCSSDAIRMVIDQVIMVRLPRHRAYKVQPHQFPIGLLLWSGVTIKANSLMVMTANNSPDELILLLICSVWKNCLVVCS